MARCPGRPLPGLSALLALAMPPPPPPPGQAWAAPRAEGGTQSPGPVGGRRRKGRSYSISSINGVHFGGLWVPSLLCHRHPVFRSREGTAWISLCARGCAWPPGQLRILYKFYLSAQGLVLVVLALGMVVPVSSPNVANLPRIGTDTLGPFVPHIGSSKARLGRSGSDLSVPCGEESAMNLPGR